MRTGSVGGFGRRSAPQLGQNLASAGILVLHLGQFAMTVVVEAVGLVCEVLEVEVEDGVVPVAYCCRCC